VEAATSKALGSAEAVEMPKTRKPVTRRNLFGERRAGVDAMRAHRAGLLTLRTHHVEPISLPELESRVVRETRESLHVSPQVFVFKLGVNPRTLERWEAGPGDTESGASAVAVDGDHRQGEARCRAHTHH
jgi:DNA-binding transcriptional regulator YiaG